MGHYRRIAVISLILVAAIGISSSAETRDLAQAVDKDILMKRIISGVVSISDTTGVLSASGLLMNMDEESHLLLITARHVVDWSLAAGCSLFVLAAPVADSNGLDIIGLAKARIPLYSSNGNPRFITPDDPRVDISAVIVQIDSFNYEGKGQIHSLNDRDFVDYKALSVGQKVLYPHFEPNMLINGVAPVVREGLIAGIDTVQGLVIVDGSVFLGYSGGPVFLNPLSPENQEFIQHNAGKSFVGIFSMVWADGKWSEIRRTPYQNFSLGIAVPAKQIRLLLDKAIGIFGSRSE